MYIKLSRKAMFWRVKVVGKNGEVLLVSETYYSKGNAKRAANRLAAEFELDVI